LESGGVALVTERCAATRGLRRASVNVLAGNNDAPAAYQRLGFMPVSIECTKLISAA